MSMTIHRPGAGMQMGEFRRIARVAELFKLHALDDASGIDIEQR